MRYRRSFIPEGTFFFTLVTHQRRPLLAEASAADLWRAAVGRVKELMPFTVEAEVILPDHLHMLWSLPEGDGDYPTRMRLAKTLFTRGWARLHPLPDRSESRTAKGEQALWQRRYWEHTIRDEADFNAHLDDIHINPVRHGLVALARDWPHSTFRTWQERGIYEPWWGSADMPPLPEWVGKE